MADSPAVPTTWGKYKVFFFGLAGAIITALIPVFSNESSTTIISASVMAAIVAASSWFAKELRGKAQSIAAIVFAVLLFVVPNYFSHTPLNWQELIKIILGQLALLYTGYSLPPFKPSSYEHDATIVKAKEIPPVDQVPIPDSEKQIP